MKHNYEITCNSIQLRPLSSEHIEDMRLLRNQHRHNFIYSNIIEQDSQKLWYNKYLVNEGDFVFSVFCNEIWIGSVSLYNVKNSKGEFGRLLLDTTNPIAKGLGLTITLCACKIGFEQLGLKTIYLQVYSDNIPAYRTYQKAGFTKTGTSYDRNGKELIDMEIHAK